MIRGVLNPVDRKPGSGPEAGVIEQEELGLNLLQGSKFDLVPGQGLLCATGMQGQVARLIKPWD